MARQQGYGGLANTNGERDFSGKASAGPTPDITTGVEFDGTNDYLSRGADLTGISDGTDGTISLWIKTTGTSDRLLINNTARFLAAVDASGKFSIIARDSSDTALVSMASTAAINDGDWHHVLASWSTASGGGDYAYIYVDGSDDTDLFVLDDTGTDIDYTGTNWGAGATSGGSLKYDGCMGELWFHTVTFDASDIADFLSSNNPVSLGTDGSTPTGGQPLVYLSGGEAQFANNFGSGGTFTENGALVDCAITGIPTGSSTSQTYYCVTVAMPTSTGNQTISGIPFDPTCCKVTFAGATATDTGTSNVYYGMGFSDGTNQVACGTFDEDNVSTTNPDRYISADQIVYVGVASAADAKCEAVGSGLGPGTGEWVFNWSGVPGTAYLVTYEFWNVSAKASYYGLGSGTSVQDITTTGLDPNVVMMAQVGWNNTPLNPVNSDRMFFAYGMATDKSGSVVQRGVCTSATPSDSNSTLTSICWDDKITGQAYNETEDYSVGVTSFGEGKLSVQSDATASGDFVIYLAMDIGDLDAKISTVTLPTSTSTWTVSGVGFTPACLNLFGASMESGDINTIQTASPETDTIFCGVSDGYNGGGFWASDLDDFTTPGSVTETHTGVPSGLLTTVDAGGTTQYVIPVPTMNSDGFSVTPTTAVSSPTRVAFLFAMSGTVAGGATGILRQHTDYPAHAFSGVTASQLGGVLVH